MTENRCPNCRWRTTHWDVPSGRGTDHCHGGSPVTIYGDFPFVPQPPHDFCRAFEPKAPADARVHQPDYPEAEGEVPIYGCPVPLETAAEVRRAMDEHLKGVGRKP